jgi:hypothetical protein
LKPASTCGNPSHGPRSESRARTAVGPQTENRTSSLSRLGGGPSADPSPAEGGRDSRRRRVQALMAECAPAQGLWEGWNLPGARGVRFLTENLGSARPHRRARARTVAALGRRRILVLFPTTFRRFPSHPGRHSANQQAMSQTPAKPAAWRLGGEGVAAHPLSLCLSQDSLSLSRLYLHSLSLSFKTLSLSLYLSLSLSSSLSFSVFLSRALSRSHSLSLTLTFSLALSIALSLSHSLTLSLSLSLTHSHTHSLSLSLPLS